MIYCGLLQWQVSDGCFGGFNFGCFLIVALKCFIFCDHRAKEFKVKYSRHFSYVECNECNLVYVEYNEINCRKNKSIWLKYRYTRHTKNACYI